MGPYMLVSRDPKIIENIPAGWVKIFTGFQEARFRLLTPIVAPPPTPFSATHTPTGTLPASW